MKLNLSDVVESGDCRNGRWNWDESFVFKEQNKLVRKSRKVCPYSKEQLEELYRTRSLKGVGEVLGEHAVTIRNWMVALGIPRRQPTKKTNV